MNVFQKMYLIISACLTLGTTYTAACQHLYEIESLPANALVAPRTGMEVWPVDGVCTQVTAGGVPAQQQGKGAEIMCTLMMNEPNASLGCYTCLPLCMLCA